MATQKIKRGKTGVSRRKGFHKIEFLPKWICVLGILNKIPIQYHFTIIPL